MAKAVGDILDTLEASPAKLLWAEQDFRSVWSDYDTDPKAIKYKLEKTGLDSQDAVKLNGRRHYFYCRQGDRIVSKSEVPAAQYQPQRVLVWLL